MMYDFESYMETGPAPQPIHPKYRGQQDVHPWTVFTRENRRAPAERMGQADPSPLTQRVQAEEAAIYIRPRSHPLMAGALDPGRTVGNPSAVVAPMLIGQTVGRYGIPHYLIDWMPWPAVVRSRGRGTLVPDDLRHTVPKAMLDYDYRALSQQDMLAQARQRMRDAMYGGR